MLYTSVDQIVGETPILELKHIEEKFGLKANLYAKLELFNPAGSAKDRIARQMILDAEASGALTEGATIIEPTSGNTGIGLAAMGASKGYKVVIVMPDSMSIERIKLMKVYGADVVLTPGAQGMKGALDKADAIKADLEAKGETAFVAGQFVNPSNSKAHYLTTGPEIYKDLDGKVDMLVAGIGTGGTITGTGKYIKERAAENGVDAPIIVGVEPETSPLLTKGVAGPHKIQGIGANFIPDVLERDVLDEVVTESAENAFETLRTLGAEEGIFVGISSGAACHAAIEKAKLPENEGKNIVVVLPDSGDRYLSTLDLTAAN